MGYDTTLDRIGRLARNPSKIPYYARRTLYGVRGSNVCWPEPGRASLGRTYYFAPQGREVLVLNHATVISPGTERANFDSLPHARVTYPYYPGYSGSGEIVMVGAEVTKVAVGTRVAVRTAHSSLWAAAENEVLTIPDSVSYDEAAFWLLGVIAAQGLRRGRVVLGDQVAIFGQGLIGLLTTQLAAAAGACPITALARSDARRDHSLKSGAHRFVSLENLQGGPPALEADVVVETSGNPSAVRDALVCCRAGGRVVLCGSPRGLSEGIDFEMARRKGLTVVGAHQSTLPVSDSLGEWRTAEQEARIFLSLAQQERLDVKSLITDHVSPAEAEWFYRRLSRGEPGILGAIYRWDEMRTEERLQPGPFVGSLRRSQVGHVVSQQRAGMSSAAALPSWRYPVYDLEERGKTPPSHEPLRFGLVGCGEIAVLNAAGVNSAPGARLTMVMDVQESVAKDLAGKYGVPYVTDLDELLSSDQVDAVLISVPHHLHVPLVVRAAAHGKHAVVEKPISLSAREADDAIAACARAGVTLSVLYCGRYQSHVQAAKRLVAAGAMGKLLGMSVLFQADKPAAYWRGGFSGRVETDWRAHREKSGGGVFMANMVHYLDMLRYLTEAEVSHVTSELGTLDTAVEVEDTAAVTLRYDNGAIGSMMASSCTRGTSGRLEVHLWGTDGSILLRNPALVRNPLEFYSLRRIGNYQPGKWHTHSGLAKTDDRRAFIARFAEAIRKGEPPDVTGQDARAIQAIVDQVYGSVEAGQSATS